MLSVPVQRSIMHVILFIATSALISVTAHDIYHISVDNHSKTYPGQAIYGKDGQYIRMIGPVYAKVEEKGLKLPIHYWKPVNFSLAVTPTVEISSLFINGTIKFEGSTLYTYDGDEDQCIVGKIHCPYHSGVRIFKECSYCFADLGLSPGWYELNFDLFIRDRTGQKLKIGGLEIKVKVVYD